MTARTPSSESTAATFEGSPGPTLARFARPRSEIPTRLVVVTDPHLTREATGTWKVYHRTEARLRTAVERANRLRPDATLFLGDLTKDGRPSEFDAVDDVLSGLDSPWLAVPGNHDVPKAWDEYATPDVTAFGDRYGRGSYPFSVGVGGVDLVGLDSATGECGLTDTHEGALSTAQLDWLDDHLGSMQSPVVLLHHNLIHANHHTGQFPQADFYRLRNADSALDVLARHGVPLVLSGHIHWPAAAVERGVREVIAPSSCSFPSAMLLLEIDDTGTTVSLVPLADRAGVAEAYSHARCGSAHGQGIAEHAERGYFEDLPVFVEPSPSAPGADVPSQIRWR